MKEQQQQYLAHGVLRGLMREPISSRVTGILLECKCYLLIRTSKAARLLPQSLLGQDRLRREVIEKSTRKPTGIGLQGGSLISLNLLRSLTCPRSREWMIDGMLVPGTQVRMLGHGLHKKGSGVTAVKISVVF